MTTNQTELDKQYEVPEAPGVILLLALLAVLGVLVLTLG